MIIIFDKKSFIEIDKNRFIQLICEKYSIVRKSVIFRYQMMNKLRDTKQDQNETIEMYYERIYNFFIVEIDCKNNSEDVTLNDMKLM